MIRFRCPHCHATLTAEDDLVGQGIKCALCRGTLRVPSASGALAATAPRPPADMALASEEDDDAQPAGVRGFFVTIGNFFRGAFYGYSLMLCLILVAGIVAGILYAAGKWRIEFRESKGSRPPADHTR